MRLFYEYLNNLPAVVIKKLNNFIYQSSNFSPIEMDQLVFWIENEYEKVICILSIKILVLHFKNYAEIYNVSTHLSFRRLGFAYNLLKFAIDFIRHLIPDVIIWLGVDIENRNAIKLYHKLGFQTLNISNYTPSGKYRVKPFIEMLLNI